MASVATVSCAFPAPATDAAVNAAGNPAGTSTRSVTERGSPPTPTSTTSAPGSSGPEQLLRSDGGFVVARCQGGQAYLVSWTPEQGYEIYDVRRGPASITSVEFEGARGHVRLDVTCDNGVPQAHVQQEAEDDGREEGP